MTADGADRILAVVIASAVFSCAAPAAARRCPPRAGAWILSVGSVVIAASGLIVHATAVALMLGQVPAVAEMGGWSAVRLGRWSPGSMATILACTVVAGQLLALVLWMSTRGRWLIMAWRASSGFATSLVVLPDDEPVAFALPGWPGRIFTSQGLLRSLDDVDRRTILAHEQAHIDGRHDLHRAVASLAAAINPFLWPVSGSVRLVTERWADEAAAGVVGDRQQVARTIDRVATWGRHESPHRAAMGASGSQATLRVASLATPPRRFRAPWEVLLLVAMVAAAGAAASDLYHAHQLFEAAELARP